MRAFWNEIKIPLLLIFVLSIGPTQCAYDNYVKWKVAKAASQIAEKGK